MKIDEPQGSPYPDSWFVKIEPGESVMAGSPVGISVIYEKGDAKQYQPALELLRSPDVCLERPTPYGKEVFGGKTATFTFEAKEVGSYVLRLKPFAEVPRGRLIEIHVLSNEEAEHLRMLVSALPK